LVLFFGFILWFYSLVLFFGFILWFYSLVLFFGFILWFYSLGVKPGKILVEKNNLILTTLINKNIILYHFLYIKYFFLYKIIINCINEFIFEDNIIIYFINYIFNNLFK